MGVIIRNGIEYSGTGGGNIVYLTQEEYDALPETKLSNGVEYRITDANTNSTVARNISYDNSESGIEAVSVQSAIDKVSESLGGIRSKLQIDPSSAYQCMQLRTSNDYIMFDFRYTETSFPVIRFAFNKEHILLQVIQKQGETPVTFWQK